LCSAFFPICICNAENIKTDNSITEKNTSNILYDARIEETATDTNNIDLNLQSPSCILIEATTGTVLYEYNADEARKPASVTKVMTLLLVFEAIHNGQYSLDDIVTVSSHAASMGGSQCFFEAGEEQTVEDMIKCIVVASGNDAAVAMAEYTAGSEEQFVALMNSKAEELGMENTNFVNACGLDTDGHVTSSRDIAIMSRELTLNYPEIFDYSTIWMDSIIHKTARGESEFDLANTNKFLNLYTGATGLKTGYTSSAKYCMSATATRNGISLIAVIMGAETKDIRNEEACKLLDYGFGICKMYNDDNVLEETDVPVKNGTGDTIAIESDSSFNAVLLNNESTEAVTKKIKIYDDIEAPVYEGDIVGYVEYSAGDRVLGTVAVVASEQMDKMTFGYSISYILKHLV
jgi:D-alanyl-D-alanine carboxypeptidase (penicillin-binding protein 5/6)